MAKTLKEAPLTTRAARAKLPEGVHWRGVDTQVHLGYRRGKRGGVWLVRWRVSVGYKQAPLGPADDEILEGTLSFAAAIKAAREYVEVARREERARIDGAPPTVASAIVSYLAVRDARDRALRGANARLSGRDILERCVLGREARGKRCGYDPAALAAIPLHELCEADLITWRDSLPGGTSTRRRIVSDLRAALNAAYIEHRGKLPITLSATIGFGLRTTKAPEDDGATAAARENQILSDKVIGRLIVAARSVDHARGYDGDLFRLFVVMAATGARFSQVVRMRVRDLQADRSRLMVPPSRKGKGGKAEAIPIPIGADVLAELVPVIRDRARDEPLLMRWRYKQPQGSRDWVREKRAAWWGSQEISLPWADMRKAAGLPLEIVPYAFRHSSIVRGIRAGLPLQLVAALHDTSVPMIERHYGRFITDGLDEMAARAVVRLIPMA